MNIEKYYGKCINVYTGTGSLTLKDKRKFTCQFEAGQLLDGTIILLCASGPAHYFPYAFEQGVKFEGKTHDGHKVHIRGNSHDTNFLAEPTGPGSWLALKVAELVVTYSSRQPTLLRFGLTNFKFHSHRVSSGGYWHESLMLRLIDGSSWYLVYLKPVDDYRRIMRTVLTLKTIQVTCLADAEVRRNGGIRNIEKIMDNLCLVASVARGTKVQRLYCDRLDKKGNLLARIHSARITAAYNALSTIDFQKDDEDTRLFLEKTYRTFCRRREEYKLDRGSIDTYLNAKSEHGFIESRGAKLAVALEGLKATFLKRTGSSVSDEIIPETRFAPLRTQICTAIDNLLKADTKIDKDQRSAIANENKLRQLNRRPFAYSLRKLFREISFKPTERELELFIQSRNKLVHEAEFYCNAASRLEQARCKPLPNPTEEFYFLVNFLDRVYLKLLGYSGDYLNIYNLVTGRPEKENLP